MGAVKSLTLAQKLSPDSKEINSRMVNIKQKIFFERAGEHLDDRYRPKSESETNAKVNMQFPGFNMNMFLSEALPTGFPPALVMQGHIERDHNKDYLAAATYYKKAADAGDAEGMLNLSDLYLKGLGVNQDVNKAVELLKVAVTCDPKKKQGVVESYNALGLKYMRGTGVKQNTTEAKYWFKKCADLGLAEGELNLGFVLKSQGNFYEAMELFQSAAVKGCARAYANLGDLYRDGHGVKKNIEKARQMFEKAVKHGFSLDIEEELKKFDLPSLGESWKDQAERNARQDKLKVTVIKEAIDDLEAHAETSETARQILIGLQNYELGIRALNTIGHYSHDDYMLELFSSAIQQCGHFLKLSKTTKYLLGRVVESVINRQAIVNPVDLAVCGIFIKFPVSKLPIIRENPFIAAKIARELNRFGNQQKALEIINWAIAKNPHNLDLRFWKARINESIDSYSKFIQKAPLDHYWVPRAYYCIADILIKQSLIDEALETYNAGVAIEKKQLKLFNNVDLEEKRAVAFFLYSEKKLDRCPPLLKVQNARRKELITHQHNALKDHMEILLNTSKNFYKIRQTLTQHRPQPEPTQISRQKELFFNDLDLTKERIYEGFIDCLILSSPLKNFGIVTIIEDKQASTSRILLYDNISLVHIKVGQWIRIYNPYVRIAADQRSAIKITNKNCFEVLHFETICHCCTKVESSEEHFHTCQGCGVAIYCSQVCFERHLHDFQHGIVCQFLKLNYKFQ